MSRLSRHFLNHLAAQGRAYLHPGGQTLTSLVLEQLNIQTGATVLEIGCGTGATLVDLHAHKGVQVTGVDVSEQMLFTAGQRITFCRLQSFIHLHKIEPDGKLPFAEASFSSVVAESVLAITDEQVLPVLLKEIYRVLKPGGRFISNDAIWKQNTPQETIRNINLQCLDDFGIVQSISSPATLDDWKNSFLQAGFVPLNCIPAHKPGIPANTPFKSHLLSKRFTRIKKLKAFLNPRHVYRAIRLNLALQRRHQNDGQYLETYVFVLQKPQTSPGHAGNKLK